MKVCAILLSYKRQQNMQRIVDHVLKVERIDRIILSNNNPEVDIHEWVRPHERLEMINQPTRMLYTKRFEIADSLDYPYFFCPDDDLFLYASQINFVLDQLKQNPSVPHGVYGQIGTRVNNRFRMGSGIERISCEVDVLNRAYFFTKEHITRTMELSQLMGWKTINEAIYMEDSLISFSGKGRPICHNVGFLADCPTTHQKGIATYLEDGFQEIRLQGYCRLAQITGRPL